MKRLLELYISYFEFLYTDPEYRITNSKTGTGPADAAIEVTGPTLTWLVSLDRGQVQIVIAASRFTSQGNWFWISLIRQYLEGIDDIEYLSAVAEIDWARANISRIISLFKDDDIATRTCEALRVLRRENAEKQWPAG